MATPAAGQIVLIPFPFSDLSQSKVRPAVCLAAVGRGDRILSQVTSQPYGDSNAVPLGKAEFASGGLKIGRFARPGKLFTANQSLVIASVATLQDDALQRIIDMVIALLRPSTH